MICALFIVIGLCYRTSALSASSYNIFVVLPNYSVLSNGSIIIILKKHLTILDFAPRIIVRERQKTDKRENIFLLTFWIVAPRIEYHIRKASVQRRIRQAGNMDIGLSAVPAIGTVLMVGTVRFYNRSLL